MIYKSWMKNNYTFHSTTLISQGLSLQFIKFNVLNCHLVHNISQQLCNERRLQSRKTKFCIGVEVCHSVKSINGKIWQKHFVNQISQSNKANPQPIIVPLYSHNCLALEELCQKIAYLKYEPFSPFFPTISGSFHLIFLLQNNLSRKSDILLCLFFFSGNPSSVP